MNRLMALVSEEDELAPLNNARNRVLYGDYKNSLVEWTLSPAWNTIPAIIYDGKTTINGVIRGRNSIANLNSVSGEINL